MGLVFINYPLETFTPTQSGAIATWIWECCQAAKQDGCEPTVISQRCAAISYPWSRLILLDYPRLPRQRFFLKVLRAQKKLTGWRHMRQGLYVQRVLSAIRYYDLESHCFVLHNDPETVVYLRQRLPKAKILHWFHNQMDVPQKLQKAFCGGVNSVAAVSEFTARFQERDLGFSRDQVHVVYNGVDLENFRPVDEREESGIPVINFLGRTGIEKAPDLLLKSALLLSEKTRNFSIQLLGSNHWDRIEMDAYQDELGRLCRALESKGILVRRPGHIPRDRVAVELRKADINVVPSRWDEPFGLTVLEGMASGLATIASRTGGIPEVVGDAALTFERESAEGLAEHLNFLISDKDARRNFAKRARCRAEHFSWKKTWRQVSELSDG